MKHYEVVLYARKTLRIAHIPATGDKQVIMIEFLRRTGISGFSVGTDGTARNADGWTIKLEEST